MKTCAPVSMFGNSSSSIKLPSTHFFFSVQTMPQTVQTLGKNLFLGRTCLNEFWWVCPTCCRYWKPVVIELWTNSNDQLRCAFRVAQRASPQMRKLKKFQRLLFQSPHHRKPPQRRVTHKLYSLSEFCLFDLSNRFGCTWAITTKLRPEAIKYAVQQKCEITIIILDIFIEICPSISHVI